jgi:hypothetical protein
MKTWRKVLFVAIIVLLLIPTELVLAKGDLRSNIIIPAAKVKLVTPLTNQLTKDLKPNLRWKLVADATYYQLQLSPNKDFSVDVLDKIFIPVNDTLKTAVFTATDYGDLSWLTPNRRYYWHVRGCGSDQVADCGVWSVARFFIPKYGDNDKPLLDSPADGSVDVPLLPTFKWSRLPNDDLYEIMITSPYNIRRHFVKPDPADANFASFTPTNKLAGYTYFSWKVRAVGKSRWYYGPWSEAFHFKTVVNPNPPPKIDRIILTAPRNNVLTDTTKPELRWKAKEEMFRYQVQISWDATFASTEKIDTSIAAIDNATAYAFLASDYGDPSWLTENRRYSWRVRGCKDDTEAFCTVWSTRSYIPRYRSDQVPVLISVIDNATAGSLQPELKWQRLPNDWKYEIWLRTNSKVQRFWFTPTGSDSEATFIPPMLKPGVKYSWRVRVVGYKNMYYGKNSEIESFFTPAPTP